ncbi:hypothetical protein ACOMDM_09975 [Serratia plymuthica]|uniref:hypothetical protein n=1 Tax=Serratia plymuthica TaxID=82996 RepID=UPI00141A024E|nr:hypothetical protein [Serratia plymuthica]NIC29341.1 hypothetical protein [Serratia plymuthica]
MSTNVELIVNAINGLKNDGDIVKDYIFPIASSFISASLGVVAAKLTFRQQEKLKNEITKVNLINKVIISMGEARGALLAIKHNYKDLTQTHFIARALEIPPIIIDDFKLVNNANELSFLVGDEKDYDDVGYQMSWANILRISMMINNCNHIYVVLKKRNELWVDLMEKISSYKKEIKHNEGENISYEMLVDACGEMELIALCDLTERFVSFLDDILFEVNDFMFNFPELAGKKVDKKIIKGHVKVLKYQDDKVEIKRTIAPDYDVISTYMDMSVEEVKARYDNGYKRN